MNRNLTELSLGIIVLIAATLFIWMALGYSSVSHHQSRYTTYAQFDRADGVNIGSIISIAGVNIGEVTAIQLDPKTYRAKLTMAINRDISLPSDSIIEIASEGLMGGKYINITPGGSDEHIQPNGLFQFTQSAISFESLLSKFLFNQAAGGK